MCCDTKAKIAAAVRELMQKRPVSKITVQDVMERTDMTRQSFYYHFQDIYNVLEWNITECMKDELKFRKDQSFEDWCRLVMSMLRDNQAFCRKVGDALGRNKIQEILLPYVRPQMERLIFAGQQYAATGEEETYVLEFACQTFVDNMLSLVFNKNKIDVEDCLHKIGAVFRVLGLCDGEHTEKTVIAC